MTAGSLPFGGGEEELAGLLGRYLARQEWAQSAVGVFDTRALRITAIDAVVLRPGRPGLASVMVDAGEPPVRLHVLVGWREVAQGTAALVRPGAVLGTGSDGDGEVLVYDALADRELCLELLASVTRGRERARSGRVVDSLVSHASLVYDERLFMKCYRVIEPGTRPEVEVTLGLDRVGFNHMLAPVAHWARSGGDLALVREFMPGAVEGKALALTSLRDLLARSGTGENGSSFEEIGRAGGDLGDEMRRLGGTTAELHLALAEAFSSRPGPSGRTGEIRVHGDYHLRRVMRVDAGWLVAGFGDDPLIGAAAGTASQGEARYASPLEDVADMFVSLQQVAAEATELQPLARLAHARELASGWVRHNKESFLRGYLESGTVRHLAGDEVDEIRQLISEKVASRPPRSR